MLIRSTTLGDGTRAPEPAGGSIRTFVGGLATNGREVELREDAGVVQWRYVGDGDWTDLYDVPAGGGGSGSVETVDQISPDDDGDVDLGLAPVARSGSYDDISGTPTLGTAAAADADDFEAAGTSAAAIAGEVTRADGAYDHAGAAAAAQSASQPVDSDLTAISVLTTTGYGRAFLTLANQGALMALLGSSSDTAQGVVELATGTEAVTGTDTARAVTPAGLKAALDDLQGRLVDGAPGILDTFAEVATQLASDESAVAALTTAVSGKLGKSANLSDLLSVSTARTNLGLGDVATHSVSEFQPTDSDLTAIAALTTSPFGRGLLTSADAAALRTAAALGNSATRDVGTTSGTVAAGDDSRIVGAAQKASNLSDLASASTARTNLGLGTAATKDTGTSSGNVPLLGTGGRLAIAQVASGTPDGTKFVRDDGTLVTPAGGGANKDPRWSPLSGQTTVDEFNDASLDAAWVRVDGTGAASGNLTWTENGDVLSAYNIGGDTTDKLHALVRPLSGVGGSLTAGDAFVTCLRFFAPLSTDHSIVGLILADGSTFGSGNQVIAEVGTNATNPANLQAFSWTNFGTSGTPAGIISTKLPTNLIYIRLVMTATNTWRADYSGDGVSWIKGKATLSKTMTATHVGFFSTSYGTSTEHIASYEFIRRVAGVS